MERPDQALVALHRFGLGAKPGERARAAQSPQAFVLDQLRAAPPVPGASLPASDAAIRLTRLDLFERQDARKRADAQPASMEGQPASPAPPQPPARDQVLYRDEAAARFEMLAQTDAPLLERLTLFWANHFAIAVRKAPVVRAAAGAFEREAIRPFVLAPFREMLRAATQHPAMLVYLDNFQSIGPESRAGQNNHRGLNENLAREILELHTLGVDGGYSQEDVTAFARILTGWTMVAPGDDDFYGGRFTFSPQRHEPGPQTMLGKSYPAGGVDQARATLDDLARHPATARHLARKLARHFIADEPPPALVQKLQDAFVASGGDLLAVTRALVSAPEAWSAPLTKIRSPHLFLAAMARAAPRRPEPPALLNQLNAMGQPLWNPPGPNGYPDDEGAWGSPEGIVLRLDIAAQWGRLNAAQNPLAVLDETLGPAAAPATREAIARAESRAQGLALLFMSPEFQRC